MSAEQSKNNRDFLEIKAKEGFEVDEAELLGHGLFSFEAGQGRTPHPSRPFDRCHFNVCFHLYLLRYVRYYVLLTQNKTKYYVSLLDEDLHWKASWISSLAFCEWVTRKRPIHRNRTGDWDSRVQLFTCMLAIRSFWWFLKLHFLFLFVK